MDPVEIDQPLQRASQGPDVVIAAAAEDALKRHQGWWQARLIEAFLPKIECMQRTQRVYRTAVADGDGPGWQHLSRNGVPECAKPLDLSLRWITGDDCRVDRSDRETGEPVWPDACFQQCGMNTRLVGAKGTAALQDQRNAAVGPEMSGDWSFEVTSLGMGRQSLRFTQMIPQGRDDVLD